MQPANSSSLRGDAMKHAVVTAPTEEPISLADAKLHLRVASTETGEDALLGVASTETGEDALLGAASTETGEDALLGALIAAAREWCEGYTGRALATQTIEAYPDRFPRSYALELPMPPLQDVVSIKYKDSTGTEVTLTEDEDYIVDISGPIGRIALPYGKLWPAFDPYPVNPIAIRYTAGYTAMPKIVRQAMLLLIGHWYANREPGALDEEMRIAVGRLLLSKRVRWW